MVVLYSTGDSHWPRFCTNSHRPADSVSVGLCARSVPSDNSTSMEMQNLLMSEICCKSTQITNTYAQMKYSVETFPETSLQYRKKKRACQFPNTPAEYVQSTKGYFVASMACLISWKVRSGSLSKPMEKRMRPSLMPISFWMSSGTSEEVDLPELLNRVLK